MEQEHSLKRKISIARFSNETAYGQGNLFNTHNKIGKQAMDILSTKLTQTGKFLLFERPDIEKITNESKEEMKEFKLVSDYLIVGSVSEFGRKNTSEVGVFSRTKKQTANAKVNVRLINIKTGQVIYAEEGSGEAFSETGTVLGAGSKAGYDSSLNDKALSAAISKLVSNIVENLLNEPWRAYILEIDNKDIIISGGESQNIKSGDVFLIKKRGKIVENPQTGLELELPGEEIGRIKIKSFYGKTPIEEISFCELIEGNLDDQTINEIYIEEMEE
jgi:curli biogenesis system outer membrane secretion channel CsgG